MKLIFPFNMCHERWALQYVVQMSTLCVERSTTLKRTIGLLLKAILSVCLSVCLSARLVIHA